MWWPCVGEISDGPRVTSAAGIGVDGRKLPPLGAASAARVVVVWTFDSHMSSDHIWAKLCVLALQHYSRTCHQKLRASEMAVVMGVKKEELKLGLVVNDPHAWYSLPCRLRGKGAEYANYYSVLKKK